jgi:hypothetical protein
VPIDRRKATIVALGARTVTIPRRTRETAPRLHRGALSCRLLGVQWHTLAGLDRWHVLREKLPLPVPSQLMSGRLRVATLRLIRSRADAVLSPFLTTIPP